MSVNDDFSRPDSQLAPQPAQNFSVIYNLLMQTPFNDQSRILDLEQQLYALLKQNPENVEGLVLLMQQQIMRGQHQKAQALAYKIWDLGSEMPLHLEALYLENLLNVGLLDMAAVVLKPLFDDLPAYKDSYYAALLKYALLSGNLFYLEKFTLELNDPKIRKALSDLVAMYRYLNINDQFRQLQSSLLEMYKDVVLACEYNIYTDRGFTDLEFVLFVDSKIVDPDKLSDKLNMQITAFCIAKNLPRLNNLGYLVRDISEHPLLRRPLTV